MCEKRKMGSELLAGRFLGTRKAEEKGSGKQPSLGAARVNARHALVSTLLLGPQAGFQCRSHTGSLHSV